MQVFLFFFFICVTSSRFVSSYPLIQPKHWSVPLSRVRSIIALHSSTVNLNVSARVRTCFDCSAGLIYSTSKFEHVTQMFLNLHLLPVEQRIIFKIALATFKALHDFVPSYITELIRPYNPDRTLPSSIHNLLFFFFFC